MLEQLRTAVRGLVYSADPNETRRLQGVAQALIAVLGLPETLEDEIVEAEFRRESQEALRGAPRGIPAARHAVEEY